MFRKILLILSLLAVAFIIYVAMFFANQTDTEVFLDGYVLDKTTGRPIKNVTVFIHNERYESDSGYSNYDEYLGKDTFQVKTNDSGYYSIKIEKSAFIYIELIKDGYSKYSIPGKFAQSEIHNKTYLEK